MKNSPSYTKHFIFIFLVIAGLISLLVFMNVGKAKILVTAKQETVSQDFNAEIVNKNDLSGDEIKGRILSTTVRGSEKIEEVGRKETDKPATGTVTIHNKLDHDQPLIATTRLQAPDGKIFRIKDRVTAKAGQTVTAEVYADVPGKQGEIEPTTFIIPGIWEEWHDKIYATSESKMTGGWGETDYVSDDTINRGEEIAIERIKEEGKSRLNQQLTSSERILEDAIKVETVNSSASVEPGAFVSEFDINVELKLTAVVFDEDSLYKLAEEKLRNEIPENITISKLDKSGFSYSLEVYDLDRKTATLATHIEAETISPLDLNLIDKNKLVGRTKEEVIDYLSREQDIGEVEIIFSPTWKKTVPSNENKIEIETK